MVYSVYDNFGDIDADGNAHMSLPHGFIEYDHKLGVRREFMLISVDEFGNDMMKKVA